MPYIVDTDNFGGDYPDEKFVALAKTDEGLKIKNIDLTKDRLLAAWWPNKETAQKLADAANREWGQDSPRYFKVVSDDYALQPGFEP